MADLKPFEGASFSQTLSNMEEEGILHVHFIRPAFSLITATMENSKEVP